MRIARPAPMVAAVLLSSLLVTSCERQPDRNAAAPKQAPAFSCIRYVTNYNEGACPWTVRADDRGGQDGNVWFEIVSCARGREMAAAACATKNGPCTIQPTCVASMHYTYSSGVSSGTFQITDRMGRTGSWRYSGQNNPISDNCPRIQHSGSTGPMNLNDPRDGDISFTGCDWDVPAARGASVPAARPAGARGPG